MNIAIHSKFSEPEKILPIKQTIALLQKRNVNIALTDSLTQNLQVFDHSLGEFSIISHSAESSGFDYFFSLGGDGTLLDTVTYVKEKETPILAINTGRLGFLATIPPAKLEESIEAVLNGFVHIEKRSLIHLESDRDLFDGLNFGLNEFTILKRDTSSMIVVHTYIDGAYLNSYWADGLIIATPTGSTGYSLSVGGPVVMPESKNFIIAPVSPHNLNVRPLVVSDDSVISFEIEGRSENFLISLDSRSVKVDSKVQLAVRKGDFKVALVKLNGDNFLNTLRLKLNWGLDARN